MEKPTVSIIINNFNYGQFLGKAIDSALSQSYPFIEVLVVDDGSTDNSRELIDSYDSKIVSLFKKNEGQASAFNAGFEACKGEIICFMDADDVFLNHKIEEVVKVFNNYSDIGWFFHALHLVDIDTKDIVGKTRVLPSWSQTKMAEKCNLKSYMENGKIPFYLPPTSGLCFRRSLLEQIFPLPVTFIKTHADVYLRSCATWLGSGYFSNESLTYQGIHQYNTATNINHDIRFDYTGIVNAYLLRAKFPKIRKLSDRIFAKNLIKHWANKPPNQEYDLFVQKYFALASLSEKISIYLKTLYYSLPFRTKYSHQLLPAKATDNISNSNINKAKA
ncbi:MAG: glycosyltransferase [Cyanobacteria bacterium P01_A01_bin.83]